MFNPTISNECSKKKMQINDSCILANRWIILRGLGKPRNVVDLDF